MSYPDYLERENRRCGLQKCNQQTHELSRLLKERKKDDAGYKNVTRIVCNPVY